MWSPQNPVTEPQTHTLSIIYELVCTDQLSGGPSQFAEGHIFVMSPGTQCAHLLVTILVCCFTVMAVWVDRFYLYLVSAQPFLVFSRYGKYRQTNIEEKLQTTQSTE